MWCWPLPNCFCLCPLIISCSLNLPRQGLSRRKHALPSWECLQRKAGGTGSGGFQGSLPSLQHTQSCLLSSWGSIWMVTALLSSLPLELEDAWKDQASPVLFALVPLWFLLLSPSSEGKRLPWCVSPSYWRIFSDFWKDKDMPTESQHFGKWGTSCFFPLLLDYSLLWGCGFNSLYGWIRCKHEVLVSPPGVKACPK